MKPCFNHNLKTMKDISLKSEEKGNHIMTTTPNIAELRLLTGSKVGQTQNADSPESSLENVLSRPMEKTQLYTSPLNYLGYYSGRQRRR